ncbi:hypothetical protein JCM8202_001317 [Rhodotorula sphaerocarpa]
MRAFATAAAFFAAVSTAVAQSNLIINTPTALYQCQPYLVTWGGGQGPYYVRVLPGGQLSASPIATLDSQPTSDNQFTWDVNIPAGTSITLTVTDSTGTTASTAPISVADGGSSSCLNVSGSSGLASSGSATNGQSTPASTSLLSSGSAASSAASSVSSSASSAMSSVSSMASSMSSSMMSSSSAASASQTSSAASRTASAASGTTPSSSTSPTSGAGKVVVPGFAGLAAVGVALFA